MPIFDDIFKSQKPGLFVCRSASDVFFSETERKNIDYLIKKSFFLPINRRKFRENLCWLQIAGEQCVGWQKRPLCHISFQLFYIDCPRCFKNCPGGYNTSVLGHYNFAVSKQTDRWRVATKIKNGKNDLRLHIIYLFINFFKFIYYEKVSFIVRSSICNDICFL